MFIGMEMHESETVRLSWRETNLQIGHTVEFSVLSDGEGDPPAEAHKSSGIAQQLILQPELARDVVSLVSTFDAQLMQLIKESNDSESEHKKFALAVGHAVAELADRLLYPIYRRHRELAPDELKGELL